VDVLSPAAAEARTKLDAGRFRNSDGDERGQVNPEPGLLPESGVKELKVEGGSLIRPTQKEWPRIPGPFQLRANDASIADAVRSEDHLPARGYDALPDQRAVGAIRIAVPVIVAVTGSNAGPERTDLDADAAPISAKIQLSGRRNSRNQQSSSRRGEEKFVHDSSPSSSLLTLKGQRISGLFVSSLRHI
jgi:hypothetical protein